MSYFTVIWTSKLEKNPAGHVYFLSGQVAFVLLLKADDGIAREKRLLIHDDDVVEMWEQKKVVTSL